MLSKLSRSTDLSKEVLAEARELCSDLKILYTAITRARNNLIIYDENGENRLPIEKIWQRLGVVQNEQESLKKKLHEKDDVPPPNAEEVRA